MLKTLVPLYDLLSLDVSGEISRQPTVIQLILPAMCQISLAQLNAVDSLHEGVLHTSKCFSFSFNSTVLIVLMDDVDHSHRFLFVNTETGQ